MAFPIQLPPVKHLVRIHIVPTRDSRYRRTGYERLFHNLSTFLNRAAPLPTSSYPYLKLLILCVHDSSLWTQLFVSTKAIIFDYSHFVHTVRTGRLRYMHPKRWR